MSKPANPTPPSAAGSAVSDKAALNSFPPAAASPSQGCGAAPAPPPKKPCDIDDVVLVEKAGAIEKHYVIDSNAKGFLKFIDKKPESGPRSISIKGGAGAPSNPSNILQVVSFPKGSQRNAKISVEVTPFAVGDPEHVSLRIDRPDEAPITAICSSKTTKEFAVYSRPYSSGLGGLIERLWTYDSPTNHYWIEVSSCGFRNSGPVVHNARMHVEVFRGDQVKLMLTIPAMSKYSIERTKGIKAAIDKSKALGIGSEGVDEFEQKIERRYQGAESAQTYSSDYKAQTSTTKTEISHAGVKRSSETVTDNSDGVPITNPTEYETDDADPDIPSLSVTINDQPLEIGEDLKKIAAVLKLVKQGIKGIQELITDLVPQAGFKFEFAVEFCSGNFALTWGYRENSDYRVYYGCDISIAFVVFKVSLFLSFGAKIGSLALARVEGGIEDMKLEVSQNWKFNTPDQPVSPSFKDSLDIPAVLRCRAEAGLLSFRVKREYGVKSGFTVGVEIKLNENSKFVIEAKTVWTGIDAYKIVKTSPTSAERGSHYHVVDEKPIWEGTLPL